MEDVQSEEGNATALLNAAKRLIEIHKAIGTPRAAARETMVPPGSDADDPGVIFDMLWPEGS